MTHTLVSFLGKVPKEQGGKYKTVPYRFEDGYQESISFFGLALQHYLKPDRLVILGTTGSMWDVLIESLDLGDELLEEREQLIDAANSDATEQHQLDILAPLVSQRLGNHCELRLIPYGKDSQEQIDILQKMAQGIEKEDTVSLDVTHGLRHLPILVILSALYLQSVLSVKLKGIYYGAFEMKAQDMVPVLRLDGLLEIAQWIQAIHSFNKDQDYAVFAPFLQPSELANALKSAAFFERTFNLSEAAQKLATFTQKMPDQLAGVGQLFSQALSERTHWYKQSGNSHYARQRELAYFYLENQYPDYPRAAIFAFEAFITRLIPKGENVFKYESRRNAQDHFEQQAHVSQDKKSQAYFQLKKIRNGLAHGNFSKNQETRQLLCHEEQLRQTLLKLMKDLLP